MITPKLKQHLAVNKANYDEKSLYFQSAFNFEIGSKVILEASPSDQSWVI